MARCARGAARSSSRWAPVLVPLARRRVRRGRAAARRGGGRLAGVRRRADGAAAELARRRAPAADIRTGLASEVGFEERSFDVVCAFHVLEHMPDARAFLRELARFARPGGLVVVETPNYASLLRRRHGSNWIHLRPLEHLAHFTPQTMRGAFAGAGLEPFASRRRRGSSASTRPASSRRSSRCAPAARAGVRARARGAVPPPRGRGGRAGRGARSWLTGRRAALRRLTARGTLVNGAFLAGLSLLNLVRGFVLALADARGLRRSGA